MKNTIKYSFINSGYWMTFCAFYAYANYFMLSKGFLSNQIGIIIAVGNLMAFIFQPIVATFADNSKKITLKQIIIFLSSLLILLAVILIITDSIMILIAISISLGIALLFCIQPLVNSITSRFEAVSIRINFGIARSMGSLTYALISYLLGYLLTTMSSEIVMITVTIVALIMIVATLSLKIPEKEDQHDISNSSYLDLFRKYPSFIYLAIGVAGLFYFHTYVNIFMIQLIENLNGTTEDMGLAIAIAATVEIPVMFFFSRLLKRFRASQLLMISAVFYSVKAVAVYFSVNITFFLAQQLLQMFAFALFTPASVIYTNEVIDSKDIIKAQTLLTTANTFGATICSLVVGYQLSSGHIESATLTAMIISIIGTLFMIYAVRNNQNKKVISNK